MDGDGERESVHQEHRVRSGRRRRRRSDKSTDSVKRWIRDAARHAGDNCCITRVVCLELGRKPTV